MSAVVRCCVAMSAVCCLDVATNAAAGAATGAVAAAAAAAAAAVLVSGAHMSPSAFVFRTPTTTGKMPLQWWLVTLRRKLGHNSIRCILIMHSQL